jgi:hypothetical protein
VHLLCMIRMPSHRWLDEKSNIEIKFSYVNAQGAVCNSTWLRTAGFCSV